MIFLERWFLVWCGVALLYTLVNYVCVRTLGVATLAETQTPASAVMRMALGSEGATIIALGIAISTLGFLSQSVLTAPRVYFAMANDRAFLPAACLDPSAYPCSCSGHCHSKRVDHGDPVDRQL